MPTRTRTQLRRERRLGGTARSRTRLPPDPSRRGANLDGIRVDGRDVDLLVGKRLRDARLNRVIEGANTVELDLWDGDRRVLTSGVLGYRVLTRVAEVTVDGLTYTVAGFGRAGPIVTVTCEDAIVTHLKRDGRDKPISVARGRMTCAAFCAMLIRRAGVRCLVLDEDVVQPRAGVKKLRDELARARRDAAGERETSGRASIKRRGGTGTADGGKACQLTYYAPNSGGINGRPGGGAAGVPLYDTSWGCAAPPRFPFGTIIRFSHGDRSVDVPVLDRGSAIQGDHFDLLPGPMRALTGKLGTVDGQFKVIGRRPVGKTGADGKRPTSGDYDALGGGGSDDGAAWIKSYRYARERDESTYTCVRRLLDEVNWRVFVREGVVVIASEPALARGLPALALTSETLEQDDFEQNRALRAGEATLQARLGRYDADPGEAIEIDTVPQLEDVAWIIEKSTVGLRADLAVVEVSCRVPQDPKAEPSAEIASRQGEDGDASGGDEGAGDLKAISKRISRAGAKYVWGGPVGGARADLSKASDGDGMDCSGGTAYLLREAGYPIRSTPHSSAFVTTLKPGRGRQATVWGNQGHVFLQANDGSWRHDTGGGLAPHHISSGRSTAGFQPSHFEGM